MSTPREHNVAGTGFEESSVVAFLRKHPEFFDDHRELLEELKLSHGAGRAISLIERQVVVLREKNHQLKKQLNELVAVARDNDKLYATLHKLTLQLMQARGAGESLTALNEHLREQFPNESLAILLLAPPLAPETLELAAPNDVRILAAADPELAHFSVVFEHGKPLCGRLKHAQSEFLFSDPSAVASAAVIPLRCSRQRGGTMLGLIAIGSREAQRFHPTMGTVFINYMGQVVSSALEQHLD